MNPEVSTCHICYEVLQDIGPSETPPFTGRMMRCPYLEEKWHEDLRKRHYRREMSKKTNYVCRHCGEIFESYQNYIAHGLGHEHEINAATNQQVQQKEHKHVSGLTRSHKSPSYYKIPFELLQCLADRFDLGAETRSPGTDWYHIKEKSIDDDDFYRDTLNHAQEHLSHLMNNDFSEDDEWGHLGAIAFMCAVRAWRLGNRERIQMGRRQESDCIDNRAGEIKKGK